MPPVASTPLTGPRVEEFYSSTRNTGPRARFGPRGCVLDATYADSAQEIKAFQVRPDDVWIVTPPKCGTTWTQEMIWLLVNDLDFEGAKQKALHLRSPYLEFTRFSRRAADEFLGADMDTVRSAAQLPSPRCVKSHLPKDLLPDQLWTIKPKIIYVAREPKDVAVSFYHHHKLLTNYQHEQQFFYECFLDDIVTYAPFWEHMHDFWKMKDEPNILFNTYEEMKKDLPAVIRKSAKFLDKTVTEEQVARLVDHLDIKSMRENPSVNIEEVLSKLRERGDISDEQKFIRKGAVGEGKQAIPADMAAKFDERTRRVFGNNCPWEL